MGMPRRCKGASIWLETDGCSRALVEQKPVSEANMNTLSHYALPFAAGLPLLLGACDSADLPEEASQGANPTIPEPSQGILPRVNVAEASAWGDDERPTPAKGLEVQAFAQDLEHPRWLYVLPNGDVLVAETKSVFLKDLHSPFGMALIGNDLYVANTDAVVRFPYEEGATQITAKGEKFADLPGGPLNHHWTKSLVASPDGTRLYSGVGSNSNVAENGIGKEKRRAAILEIDVDSGKSRVYASGLRNPVGLAFAPGTDQLWAVVNERDELGSDLVPDYLTHVQEGGFYGWPYSYWGQHVDDRVEPQKPDLVKQAIVPDYGLGNHVAPLGLTFAKGNALPPAYADGAFIGEHGSWNREPRSGYKVVFVPFEGGKPIGKPVDVLTGFLSADEEARGRPVGVAIGKDGALLVADDVGNTIWRVTPAPR